MSAIETGKYDRSLPLASRIARLFRQPIEKIFEGWKAHPLKGANPSPDRVVCSWSCLPPNVISIA
jgi:hypothetical protein